MYNFFCILKLQTGKESLKTPMNTEKTDIRNEDMQVRMTAQETFECGRAAQVAGVTSLSEFARIQMLEGARRVLGYEDGTDGNQGEAEAAPATAKAGA